MVAPLTAGAPALVAGDVPSFTLAAEEEKPGAGCKNAGEVLFPLFRAPNADLNMTIAMLLIAIVTVQVLAIRSHGVGHYLKEIHRPADSFPACDRRALADHLALGPSLR